MKTIIVIEDDAAILDIVNQILQSEGYHVVVSHHKNLIADIEKAQSCILLLDEWMAVKKGSELIKELKQNPATKNVPVILFSAINNLEQVAKRCGADAYLKKPFDIDELINVVKSFSS
ncbi:response regulator [Rubrolithibacter danxiaensis]|uniref:response regulator n=1 Tax=Rubrolithibacter danxiaensis TaxID=3390805 RepID=UPI003BF77A3E